MILSPEQNSGSIDRSENYTVYSREICETFCVCFKCLTLTAFEIYDYSLKLLDRAYKISSTYLSFTNEI